ncbi:hypothetical protein G6F37_010601 [Rhizopus arrhizus]|nr:hypothetical protein G6F38_010729 [Rhizopus arrhizus]KAG1153166.1 hypothetical protein G6F37_010601 [Rhizopus arrhizus]
MAIKLKITSALLIPINILKMMSILGIMLIFASLIGLLSSFHTERRSIHVLRTTTIAITFLYHVSIAVIVYIQAVHTTSWLSQTWAEATTEYRLYAQTKFNCCGFTNPSDHPVLGATCAPNQVSNSAPPCYGPMNQYIKRELTHVYIALFTSLVIELLALCNSVIQLCIMSPNRPWEVSPECVVEKKKCDNVKECQDSSDTLISPHYTSYKRQF